MPRLFFGLEIPEAIKTSLLQVKTQVAGARWQSRGQLHLTLAFIGQVEEQQVALACDLARGVTQSPFEFNVQGLGCFGSPEKPKILWAGVSPEYELRELQINLANKLTANGFTLENPNFKPHITLSRFRV
jgi:2'-5' RNA ligase